ncbi:ead/Ea22-like family protein [Escherichia coli]|nr:ead/Ea22-like family protein [Escherichia coli]
MSKIDYQKLREIAEKTKIAGEAPVMPFDQRINALNDFMKHFSPDIALALLDELERNQQYIKSRDQENEDIALTVGKLRVELEAAENNLIDSECHVAELEEALRDKQALLEASEKRIAELEAELVSQTYKLNELSGNSPVTPDGWISCSDRMPEDTKMLLAFSQGQIVAAYWNWVMSPIDYKKYRAFTYLSGNILDDVTHWMPLPEPPEQDGE